MRKKNLCPLNLLMMLFLICLQIFLNLHSTIVGNDAHLTSGLIGHTESKDNDYWLQSHESFYETLQLPVAVYPVILDYYPLTPDNVRSEISKMIKECKEKNLSQSDFNKLQIEIVKMLVTWKYNHKIGTLTAALNAVQEKQKYLITKSANSSETADYETLYDRFLQNPVPVEKKTDLWPPPSISNSSKVPSNLQLAIQELPVWCRLKANVLVHSINHFPRRWHTYSYKRLVKALENYYINKREIEECNESDEGKAICLRENEEYLALNLTAEVIEYTAYFENHETWYKGVGTRQTLTLKLESFTYPHILALAQGLPSKVHEPLIYLYACFRIRRKENASKIADLQKSLHTVLSTYVNEENETLVTDAIKQLFNACAELGGPAKVKYNLDKRYSYRRTSFTVRNPPSTLLPQSSFVEQETGQTSASVEQDTDAEESRFQVNMTGPGGMVFNMSQSTNTSTFANFIFGNEEGGPTEIFSIVNRGKGPGSQGVPRITVEGDNITFDHEYDAGAEYDVGANQSNEELDEPDLDESGMCNVFLYNTFYQKYFKNSPE